MVVGKLIEVVVYVEDMNRQVYFYRDKIGLSLSYPTGVNDFKDACWVTFETGDCTLALHAGGKKQQGADAPKFVFDVSDINQAREELIERGVRLGEIRSPAPGVLVCDGIDPEGNRFSIESKGPKEPINTENH